MAMNPPIKNANHDATRVNSPTGANMAITASLHSNELRREAMNRKKRRTVRNTARLSRLAAALGRITVRTADSTATPITKDPPIARRMRVSTE